MAMDAIASFALAGLIVVLVVVTSFMVAMRKGGDRRVPHG